MLDLALLWIGLFGFWPWADPGHAGQTTASALDITLHLTAWILLATRWTLVRRTHDRR